MTAALVFGETLAAAVVAVMYSGGTFLEATAVRCLNTLPLSVCQSAPKWSEKTTEKPGADPNASMQQRRNPLVKY